MSDPQVCDTRDPDLPEIIEEGTNPGWRIRVGVSRQFVAALVEAEEQGIWFETEVDLEAYVRAYLQARAGADQ
jgi:hypothetical protein